MLTERIIRGAKPDGKARTIWDRQVTGFGLQITPTGKKNFVLRYPVKGKWCQRILCRAGQITLDEARRLAAEVQLRVRAGESDPLGNGRDARPEPTVAEGVRRFFEEYAPSRIALGRLSERTVRDYRHQAHRHILPALGGLKVGEVGRADVEGMVRPMEGTWAQRNRVLALTSRLFTLFETWGWRPQHTNPCRGVERSKEVERDRTLSTRELAALSRALREAEQRHPASVFAIRFASVTGLRIGEVLAMRWEHVDVESGWVHLPRTKTGPRRHDLPEAALAILSGMPRINGWVFTSGTDTPVSYRWVRKVFLGAVRAAGLEDVRLHDLRRTVMTLAAAMPGQTTYVLRDLLGHKTEAMANRYIRAVGNPVRQTREQVGHVIAAMMEGEA